MMIKQIKINPKELPFDIKVSEACKSCKRYGLKATCPPHIESIRYYCEVLKSYKYGRIYYTETKINDVADWEKIGKATSLKIHFKLLTVRNSLFKKGHYFINIFGAGSCKMCPECSFPCRHPQKSIVPLEATGVNVVELMKSHNVDITFPVKDIIYRVGMVLYD